MQLQGSYTGSCPEAVARDTVGALVNRRQRLHPSSSCPRNRASRATGKDPRLWTPASAGVTDSNVSVIPLATLIARRGKLYLTLGHAGWRAGTA